MLLSNQYFLFACYGQAEFGIINCHFEYVMQILISPNDIIPSILHDIIFVVLMTSL